MPIKFKNKEYETAPQGLHNAVCVDVVDLGIVDTPFGPADQIKIVWQLEEENKKGYRFLVSKRYNPSKSPKSNLRKMLEAWRLKPFTKEEMNEFDIEKLIGVNCQITIGHKVTDDATYANVLAVTAQARGTNKLFPSDYTREIERPGYVPPNSIGTTQYHEEQPMEDEITDDDIPF